MGEKQKTRLPGTVFPNLVPLFGTIEITAAGAILNQTGDRDCGVTWTKNATAGRYDGVIHKGYKRFVSGSANVMCPTAGDVKAATDGNTAYLNGMSSAQCLGTSPISTLTIQCQLPTGVATATNPKSGDIISWVAWFQER